MRRLRSVFSSAGIVMAAGAVGFAGVYGFAGDERGFAMPQALAQTGQCVIKGNVNTQGERIYHVPGQRYYNDTVISASHGERWFCSEAEARAAGWRRSKV